MCGRAIGTVGSLAIDEGGKKSGALALTQLPLLRRKMSQETNECRALQSELPGPDMELVKMGYEVSLSWGPRAASL